MQKEEILHWLREDNAQSLEKLWKQADEVRAANVGNEVHLRGLIELSNYCVRRCGYCGINVGNKELTRYRMTFDEIIECAKIAYDFGYGTVVMQAGEDPVLDCDFIEAVIQRIKRDFSLAVTLSLGERSDEELSRWRSAGANRYLLRFETSNPALFDRIHPPLVAGKKIDRIEMLLNMRDMGYEIGSGVMIGIPGQSCDDLANDILTFERLDLDMIGVGPYIPHPATALGKNAADFMLADDLQVQPDELMSYKMIALTRLACPQANIPSTTALATLNITDGREKGLCRGANILMPNITPTKYRQFYEIYPSKACIFETAKQCYGCMAARINSIARTIGKGPGSRNGTKQDQPNK